MSILDHSAGERSWLLRSFHLHPSLWWAKRRPRLTASIGCRFPASLPRGQASWLFLRACAAGSWGEVLGIVQTPNVWPHWRPCQPCWSPQAQLSCFLGPLCMRWLAVGNGGITHWAKHVYCWGSDQREHCTDSLPSPFTLSSLCLKLKTVNFSLFFSVTNYMLVTFHDEVWPDLIFPTIQWELQR